MSLYGVIAGIHGNREALAAVLKALEARGVARTVCLGDIVGYNADPDECVAMVRSRCAVAIAGNHELIGLGRLDFRRCSTQAEYALRRTRRTLGREATAFLASLPDHSVLEEGLVLVRENSAFRQEDFPGARVFFFGDGHEQKVCEVGDDGVREAGSEGAVPLRKESVYFINPGSVDASRKRSRKLAGCAVFDSRAWSVEFLRVPYDSAAAEAKAMVFGYRISPLAERLYTLKRRFSGIVNRSARG